MNLTNKKSGFTLVELFIMIAIIGLLAAIAIPSFQTMANKKVISKLTSLKIERVFATTAGNFVLVFRSGKDLVFKNFTDDSGELPDGESVSYQSLRVRDDAGDGPKMVSFDHEEGKVIATIHVHSIKEIEGGGYTEQVGDTTYQRHSSVVE